MVAQEEKKRKKNGSEMEVIWWIAQMSLLEQSITILLKDSNIH